VELEKLNAEQKAASFATTTMSQGMLEVLAQKILKNAATQRANRHEADSMAKSAELEAADQLAKELHAMHAEQTKYAKLLELGLIGSVLVNAFLIFLA
jgi:hypothetical protein